MEGHGGRSGKHFFSFSSSQHEHAFPYSIQCPDILYRSLFASASSSFSHNPTLVLQILLSSAASFITISCLLAKQRSPCPIHIHRGKKLHLNAPALWIPAPDLPDVFPDSPPAPLFSEIPCHRYAAARLVWNRPPPYAIEEGDQLVGLIFSCSSDAGRHTDPRSRPGHRKKSRVLRQILISPPCRVLPFSSINLIAFRSGQGKPLDPVALFSSSSASSLSSPLWKKEPHQKSLVKSSSMPARRHFRLGKAFLPPSARICEYVVMPKAL